MYLDVNKSPSPCKQKKWHGKNYHAITHLSKGVHYTIIIRPRRIITNDFPTMRKKKKRD